MLTPRPYQQDAVDALFSYFTVKGGNPVIAMPTGTGKSVVIASFIHTVLTRYPGQRIQILTHVKELVEQNYQKLMAMWPYAPAGVFSAGLKRKDAHFPITFAGIASIEKHVERFGHQDLILVDECHLVSPKEGTRYQHYIHALKKVNPYLKVIGFTATPFRQGLGMITEGGIFDDIAFDLTSLDNFNKLVEEGYLARLVTKKTRTEINVDGVKIQQGEYSAKELQEAVDKSDLTKAALDELEEKAYDREHWLIFASGVEHAIHVGEALSARGISNVVVHGGLSTEERDEAIRKFKAGEVRAAVNNNVLTTGFDYPLIDCIGMLRPTRSTALWVQMLGRGTRPAEGKTDCLVLDFGGNTARLGPINDPVLPQPKGQGRAGQAPVKLCPQCDSYCHASATICPTCGQEFPREVKVTGRAADLDVMASSAKPVHKTYKVKHASYSLHHKEGRPTSIKVTYFTQELELIFDWVCVEHTGYARSRAREWWKAHLAALPPEMRTAGLDTLPATCKEAIAVCSTFPPPKTIEVWVNKKYPEVVKMNF